MKTDPTAPLVALAFKLQESRFGQLTYMRLYQGTMRRGDTFFNVDKREKVKIPRLVRMHSDKMEDIESAGAGEILATFGVECATGHTFTDGTRAWRGGGGGRSGALAVWVVGRWARGAPVTVGSGSSRVRCC